MREDEGLYQFNDEGGRRAPGKNIPAISSDTLLEPEKFCDQ